MVDCARELNEQIISSISISHITRSHAQKNDIKVVNTGTANETAGKSREEVISSTTVPKTLSDVTENFERCHTRKNKNKMPESKTRKLIHVKPMPNEGDIGFGHVRGYAPWPCSISKIDESSIWVKFFNSQMW